MAGAESAFSDELVFFAGAHGAQRTGHCAVRVAFFRLARQKGAESRAVGLAPRQRHQFAKGFVPYVSRFQVRQKVNPVTISSFGVFAFVALPLPLK